MALFSGDGFLGAARQRVSILKTASRTSIAALPFSLFDLAGNPGAGVLAVGNTANGIVPTDAIAGYPTINAFGGGNTGYINRVEFGSSVACRFQLFDCVFSAGAYAFNANTALTAQPSYAARIPDADYSTTELWIEAVTAFTGNLSIAVTYTNQSGVTGKTTGVIATGVAPTVGRMIQLPLAAGDTGIQKIESVVATVSTVGTFNVHVLRRVWTGRVRINNDGDTHDMFKTGNKVIYDTSALRLLVIADSTATGAPEISIDVVNG